MEPTKKYWYYHPESESHFIVENDSYEGDGLCEFIGEALNDTDEDFQRALDHDALNHKSDFTQHAKLSHNIAQIYAQEWVKTHNKLPSVSSLDKTERIIGMWVVLEKKRRDVINAISESEDRIVKSKKIQPAPAINVSEFL